MRITHRLHQVIDGAPLSIPITATGSWSDSLTSTGSGRFQIPLALSRFTPEQWQGSTMHWFHMVAEYWDDHPMYFGLIVDKFFDFDSQMLTIETVTVDDLFESRFTFGVGTYLAGDLSIESQTLRAALIQVLKRGTGWGGNWVLPFEYATPQVEAGGFSQAWRYHDWKRISDLRNIIQAMDDGPDLVFIPRVDASFNARWEVHAGNPLISGPTIDLPISVPRSNARGVRLGERGRDMMSGGFVKGEGAGDRRPVGEAGFIGGPMMAVRDTARDMVATDADLNSIALADLRKNRSAIEQWDFDLIVGDIDNPLPFRNLRLGSRLNLRHSGNAYRRPESITEYVISLAHDTNDPNVVRPEVQRL